MRPTLLSIAFCTALLATSSAVPQTNHGKTVSRRSIHRLTFSSPDGSFRFLYPSGFRLCTSGKIEDCNSAYIPTCDEDAITCVAYPRDEFSNTNFGGAGFQIKKISAANSADTCVTPEPPSERYTVYLISAKHPVETIGGVAFIHGENADVAAGNISSTDYYRAFHAGTCYELSVTNSASDYANYEPGMIKEFTAADYKKVFSAITEVLYSFRFTN